MKKHFKIILLIILVTSIFFRLYKLSYSDFQGDEVAAQNHLFGEMSFKNFLLTRSVPPGQYLVTYVSNIVFPNIDPHLKVRIPFCVAGILSIFAFYYLIRDSKDKIFLGIFLFSQSGLLIAFSRTVQYQSFVILFSILSIIFINRGIEKRKYIFILISSIISTVAILFHYDALSFIIPIIIFLIVKREWKFLLAYLMPLVVISSIFYVPYTRRLEFQETWRYITQDRISSGISQDSLKESLKIMSIYHSKELMIFIIVLSISGVLRLIDKSKNYEKYIIFLGSVLILLRILAPNINPLFIIFSQLVFGFYFILKSIKKSELIPIWFMFSFFFYGLFFEMPLTHIYTFLTPLFYLLSQRFNNAILRFLIFLVVLSSISFNYQAFIDTEREYPWEYKRYIFGEMPKNIVNGEKVRGLFGFPYNRGWRQISNVVSKLKENTGVSTYISNEKYRISKYYLQGMKWDENNPELLLLIRNPQSLDEPIAPDNFFLLSQCQNYKIYLMSKATD